MSRKKRARSSMNTRKYIILTQGPKKWFEDSDDDDNEIKWEYLEHHGVTFTDPYLPKNLSATYNGEKIP